MVSFSGLVVKVRFWVGFFQQKHRQEHEKSGVSMWVFPRGVCFFPLGGLGFTWKRISSGEGYDIRFGGKNK